MTLIVAKAIGNIAWLVADTLITSPGGDLRRREYALKIFKLSQNTIVAYSGAPEIAHRLFRATAQLAEDAMVGEFVHFLLSQTRDDSIDFILAQNGRLHVISDGVYQPNAPVAYLGDHAASIAFAGHLELSSENNAIPKQLSQAMLQIVAVDSIAATSPEATRVGFALYDAMQLVSNDSNHWTVGGPAVLACSANDFANYALFSRHNSPAFVPAQEEGWHSVDFGDASSGGHSFTVITSLERSAVSVWGIFHKQGNFGRVFIADLAQGKFMKIEGRAPNAVAFCSAISGEHGIQVTCAG